MNPVPDSHENRMDNLCSITPSDPARAPRPRHPLQRRIRRGHRRSPAQLAPPRPDQPGREDPRKSQNTARHHHRLRLARPVPHPLRLANSVKAPRRGRHPPPLRGIRRRPLRHRLPDGCQPAVFLSPMYLLRTATPASRPHTTARRCCQTDHQVGRKQPFHPARESTRLDRRSSASPSDP